MTVIGALGELPKHSLKKRFADNLYCIRYGYWGSAGLTFSLIL